MAKLIREITPMVSNRVNTLIPRSLWVRTSRLR